MSDSRRLAQELYEIRALALSHATSPQVGSSSVDGDGLVFRDGEGNDLGRIGGGEDGMEVEYLYGPKPNQPSAPIVSADANLISVRWDGLWVGGEDETDPGIVGAGSLDRVEVHVSSDEFFVPDPINSFAGVIPVTPEGGVAVVGPLAEAGDWHVVLMARGKDGQYGAPSERVHVVTTVGLMENELFGLALRAGEAMESADGKNSVYYGDEEPQPTPRLDENGDPVLDDDGNPLFNEFTEGDIWFGEGNMPHVWSDTDGWVSAADERVDAIQSVVDELESDLDAVRESADGKTSTFYKPTEPPVAESSEGDLWFDTSAEGGNTPHRFTDGVWVSVADLRVQAIRDAMDDFESDLDTVRDTANGKNRTYYQSTMPATPPARVGDLWFNTANGYRLHRNNGTTFVEVADGRIAEVEDAVENIDISGPLSEARAEWLADAAADAQTKAQNAAAAAEAAAKLYADAVATGAVEGELEGIQDYADQAAEAARQAAIAAAIAEARVIANGARDEALAAALDADAVISQTVAQFESDLDLVRESADGKNSITWSTDAPSGEGKAGDTWLRMSSGRIIGYWRYSGSSWVSMSLDATVIPNLDAGKITSGFIDSERIAADTITADKLLVGGAQNLIPGLRPGTNRGMSEFVWDDTEKALTPVHSGRTTVYSDESFFLTPGEYVVEADIKASVDGTRTYVGLLGLTPAWNYLYGISNVLVSTEWQHFSATLSIPEGGEGEVRARFLPAYSGNATATTWYRNVTLRRMVGSTLIEDGAITTGKIQAGAVGATAIAAESIDASKIVAGGIQADSLIVPGTVGSTLIKDGAITTSKIEAGSITAQSGIIASLDAGVISSGTIDAARLAAGSITADKLLVGSAANLFPDQDLTYAGGYGSWSVVDGGLERDGSGVQSGSYWGHTEFEVVPGERLSVGFTRELEGAGEVTLYVQLSPASTGAAWGSPQRGAAATSAGEASGTVTIPAHARKARLGLYVQSSVPAGQRVRVTGIRVRRMTGSTLIEDGAITTDKIAAGAITAESGVIGSLDAGKITVGEMDGARIKAGTVTADKILVGGAGNLLTNPGFTGGGTGWNLASYNPIITDSGGPTGEPVLSIQHSDSGGAVFPYLGGLVQSAAGSFAPDLTVVEAGKRYAASVWVRAGVDIPVGNAGMGFRLRELGSATLGWALPSTATNREVIPANTWAKIEGEFLVPTDTGTWNRLAFGLRANGALNGQRVEFSAPVLLPKVGATLIEDGAITTDKILAGAVTTEKITAGGIDAGVITTGELRGELIRAESIAASALAATAIDGKTITGATVRTAAAGARVEMNSQGLRQYNQFNQAIVDMTGGDVTVLGSLYSGVVGSSRVQIDSRLWAEGMFVPNPDGSMSNMLGAGVRVGREPEHSMDMFHGDYTRPGGVAGEAGVLRGPGSDTGAALYMTDQAEAWLRSVVGGDRRVDVSMLPANSVFQSTSHWGGVTLVAQAHRARSWGAGRHGHHQVWARSNAHSGTVTVDVGQATGSTESAMEWRASREGSGDSSQFVLSGSYSRMDYGSNYVVANASSANMTSGSSSVTVSSVGATVRGGTVTLTATSQHTWNTPRIEWGDAPVASGGTTLAILSNGRIGKSSSSRRYKVAEEPLSVTDRGFFDRLLNVEPKTWYDRAEVEYFADVVVSRQRGVGIDPDWVNAGPIRRQVGAIAEDLHEAGLGALVSYTADGEPESIMYDRIGAVLIPVVRELRDRVDELETTLKEMADA